MAHPVIVDRQVRAPEVRTADRTPCGICGLPGLILLKTSRGPRIACQYCSPVPKPRRKP